MKITADEEYGLRILLTIARLSSQDNEISGLATINQISMEEGITHDYAVIFLTKLKKIGLIESVRGKNGGYKLARGPEEITLHEVMKGLGESIFDSDFCHDHKGVMGECAHSHNCTIRPVWHTISNVLDTVFRSITIKQLMDSEESLKESLNVCFQDGLKVHDFLSFSLQAKGRS